MRKVALFTVIFSTLLLLSSCSFSLFSSKKTAYVALVNGEKINKERFENQVKSINPLAKNQAEAEKIKMDLLNGYLVNVIVEQKAAQLDLENDTAFMSQRDDYLFNYALDQLYQDSIIKKIPDTTPEEIDSFYRANRETYFKNPEQVKAKDILVLIKSDSLIEKNPQLKKKAEKSAKQKINQIYQKAKKGVVFDSLAKDYSDDRKTKDRGGDFGFFFERGKNSKEFDSVAFSLPLGEISSPFKDTRGYHIITVTEKKDSSYIPLDDKYREATRKGLREDKQKKRTQDFVEEVKNRHLYVFNDSALAQEDSLMPDYNWLMVIDQTDTVYAKDYKDKVNIYRGSRKLSNWTVDNKKELLRDFNGITIVIKREIEKAGYFTTWEIQQEKKKYTQQFARAQISKEGEPKIVEPTSEEIKKYYEEHKANYGTKEMLHVYHITFDDSLKALQGLEELKSGADFVEVAKKYYTGAPEVKEQAYDLGFISSGEMPEAFYDAAQKLNPGEVGGPVKTSWGYHLIKVLEKKQEDNWEKFRIEIASRIKQTQRDEFQRNWVEKLLRENKIKINQKVLKTIKIEVQG
jgi:peptidyl-prolyl cis-trans isomerase C